MPRPRELFEPSAVEIKVSHLTRDQTAKPANPHVDQVNLHVITHFVMQCQSIQTNTAQTSTTDRYCIDQYYRQIHATYTVDQHYRQILYRLALQTDTVQTSTTDRYCIDQHYRQILLQREKAHTVHHSSHFNFLPSGGGAKNVSCSPG